MNLNRFSIVIANHEQHVFHDPKRLESFLHGQALTNEEQLEFPIKPIYGYIMILEKIDTCAQGTDFTLLHVLSSSFCGWVYTHSDAPWYKSLNV